jgi:hypothetical protein
LNNPDSSQTDINIVVASIASPVSATVSTRNSDSSSVYNKSLTAAPSVRHVPAPFVRDPMLSPLPDLNQMVPRANVPNLPGASQLQERTLSVMQALHRLAPTAASQHRDFQARNDAQKVLYT